MGLVGRVEGGLDGLGALDDLGGLGDRIVDELAFALDTEVVDDIRAWALVDILAVEEVVVRLPLHQPREADLACCEVGAEGHPQKG